MLGRWKKIEKYIHKKAGKNQGSIVLFLVKFFLLSIPLYIVILADFQVRELVSLTDFLVRHLLSASGIEYQVLNNLIMLPIENGNWAAFINWDCTGWMVMYAFFALVMSSPVAWSRKKTALLMIPAIYALNILRIWFMFFYVSEFGTALYPVVHSIIWSWGLVAVALVLWAVWLKHIY